MNNIPEKYKKYDDSWTLLVDYGFISYDNKLPFAISHNPILNGILEKKHKIVQERKFARILIQKID